MIGKAKWLIVFLLAVGMAVPTFAVELTLGGFPSYMRTRARFLNNATFVSALNDEQAQGLGFKDNEGQIFFVDTTLRLTPQLVLSDSATIRAQVDVFSNNVWGGLGSGFLGGEGASAFGPRNTVVNSSLSPSDRFRGAKLLSNGATDNPGFFDVRMLHADIVLPNNLGFVRVGRQPFDWGLGILANGGHDPYSDLGFVVDRFLWLKSFPTGTGSTTLVVVSDRFTQGHSIVTGAGDGWDGAAVALIYNQPDMNGVNFTIGGYVFPYIHQDNVVYDFGGDPGAFRGFNLDRFTLYSGMLDLKTDAWRLAAEIQGGFGNIESPVDLPAFGYNKGDNDIAASNFIAVARAEYYPGGSTKVVAVEGGWAPGDDGSTPGKIEGGVPFFNPAYNLDNLLFKHIIPDIYNVESSVYNAYYAKLWATMKLSDSASFTPQVLAAFNQETENPSARGLGGSDFQNAKLGSYMATEVEGTLTWHVTPGVTLDTIGSLVLPADSFDSLMEARANAAAEVDNAKYDSTPWAVQTRLMIAIDEFLK